MQPRVTPIQLLHERPAVRRLATQDGLRNALFIALLAAAAITA